MDRIIFRNFLSIFEINHDLIIESTQTGKRFAKQHNPKY